MTSGHVYGAPHIAASSSSSSSSPRLSEGKKCTKAEKCVEFNWYSPVDGPAPWNVTSTEEEEGHGWESERDH